MMSSRYSVVICVLIVLLSAVSLSQQRSLRKSKGTKEVLVPATATMVRAWDVPRNPLVDLVNDSSYAAEQIRIGFKIFTSTPIEASRWNGNKMSCSNCHLNAGQREKALPLVGVAGAFPEYNKRAGRLFSLEDRIVGCFTRSQNSTGIAAPLDSSNREQTEDQLGPSPSSKEVLALSSYIAWLSRGYGIGEKLPWRGLNVIREDHLLPVDKLDPLTGEKLFVEKCSNCHGEDGQGMEIGDKKAGPLWGPDSWNDGAGAARVYTLAGMVRHSMPYLDPGSLSDEEAQHIAAYINSKPRPVFPFKGRDYHSTKIPIDAVYYKK